MKKLLLTLIVLASLKITTYGQLTMKQAREQEEREREQREREIGANIVNNMFPHPNESPPKPLNPPPPNNLNQLDEARRRYWAAYENGDPVELLAAKTVFSDLLFMRDLVALWTDPTVKDKPVDRLMAMTLNVVVPPGDGIPTSAQEYFAKWNLAFHGDIRPPDAGEATNIRSIIDSFNRHFPEYAPYKIARDWAEDIRAPVPLPIEKFVFDLVQRWPMPAPIEQAEKDYEVLLKIFGEDRVFSVAEKVRSAMDQDGAVKDPASLGIDTSLATEDSEKTKAWRVAVKRAEEAIANGGFSKDYPKYTIRDWQRELKWDKEELEWAISLQNREHTGYFVQNCYEVFWTLLTKDDPKLVALRQIYRARLSNLGAGLGAFTYRTGTLSLPSIVEEWQSKPAQGKPAQVTSPKWYTDMNAAISAAMSQHKKIFAYVTGSVPNNPAEDLARFKKSCKLMEDFLSSSDFAAASQNFILLKLSWDYPFTAEQKVMAKRLRVELDMNGEFPGYGVYTPDIRCFYSDFFSVDSKEQIEGLIYTLEQNDKRPTWIRSEITAGGVEVWDEGTESYKMIPYRTSTLTPTPIPTPRPTPTPTPAPYPEAADLWRERDQIVKQEYDKAWTALPDATRLQLHDEEVTFRDTIKTFDPPTRIQTLKKRIEHLKSLTSRSAAVPTTPAPIPTPTPTATPQALPESPLAPNATPTQNWKDQLAGELPTYDFAWSCLPNECKIKLHDEEVKFRESLKSLDDKTKFQMLQERIPYLENSAREANRPKVTPNPNTAAHTIRSSTPEEAEEEATLRKEYAKVWMELPASTRRLLHDAETDFDLKTKFSDPAVRNGLFRERIEYFKNLKGRDTEEQQRQEPTPAPTPVPAPAQTNAQEQMNFLAQEYDKMWEKFFAAQPESARPKLREEEIAFRASLKGITGNDLLQKITQRMVYFQTYTLTLPPVK